MNDIDEKTLKDAVKTGGQQELHREKDVRNERGVEGGVRQRRGKNRVKESGREEERVGLAIE